MTMYAHKHMNCPTCRCTDTINVNDIGEVIDPKQAEIDELVEMLEEMLYSNSTKYREKAEALIAKHKGELSSDD